MSASPYFAVESDTLGTLRVSGAITYANAARALLHAPQAVRGGTALDVDLSALENADSATLAVLIAWSAKANRRGAALRYLRAPQGLRRLARLCDVDGLLGIA
ncbi:MAG TPA: STAS domain-containing protein [Rudaea sp.]|nr:STAS domain-containing protein [Rudaea sp.]